MHLLKKLLWRRVRPIRSILFSLFVTETALLSTTIYLHRAGAHKAVRFPKVVSLLMRFDLWVTTGIVPREWIAVHRKHHHYTDVPGDPHSPVEFGLDTVQLTNANLYRKDIDNSPETRKLIAAMEAKKEYYDRLDKKLLDRSKLGLGLGIGAAMVGAGPINGAIISAVHAPAYIALSGVINAIGHGKPPIKITTNNFFGKFLVWLCTTFGYRRHDTPDHSQNHWLFGLIIVGEGLHNNHHHDQSNISFSNTWWEIDPGHLVLKLMLRLRLAKTVRDRSVTKAA